MDARKQLPFGGRLWGPEDPWWWEWQNMFHGADASVMFALASLPTSANKLPAYWPGLPL